MKTSKLHFKIRLQNTIEGSNLAIEAKSKKKLNSVKKMVKSIYRKQFSIYIQHSTFDLQVLYNNYVP